MKTCQSPNNIPDAEQIILKTEILCSAKIEGRSCSNYYDTKKMHNPFIFLVALHHSLLINDSRIPLWRWWVDKVISSKSIIIVKSRNKLICLFPVYISHARRTEGVLKGSAGAAVRCRPWKRLPKSLEGMPNPYEDGEGGG